MNLNPTLSSPHADEPARQRTAGHWTEAAVVAGTGVLAFAPIAILGPAIGWPASLRAPAAHQLEAILQAPQAVATGYGVYLLYSLGLIAALLLFATFLPALGLSLKVPVAVAATALSVWMLAHGGWVAWSGARHAAA